MPTKAAFVVLLAMVAVALIAVPASAQEEAAPAGPTPGIVVSLNLCEFNALERLNEMVQEYWAPVLDAAVEEGRLNGWGVLNHYWGDEWNWVVYYATPDASTAARTASELLQEAVASMPGDPMEEFAGMCSAHRDNIYTVAMTESAAAPGPGAGGAPDDAPRR
jgi:hypothetical protein